MTTTIEIKNTNQGAPNADWSIKINFRNKSPNGFNAGWHTDRGEEITLKPGESRTVHIWDTRRLVISEVKPPKVKIKGKGGRPPKVK